MGNFIKKQTEAEYKERGFNASNTPAITLTTDKYKCNYDKKQYVFLLDRQHKIYTTLEWDESGRDNDELIAVVFRGRKGYYAIDKKFVTPILCTSEEAIPTIPQYATQEEALQVYNGEELYDAIKEISIEREDLDFRSLTKVEELEPTGLNYRLPTLAELVEIVNSETMIATIGNAYGIIATTTLFDTDMILRSITLMDDVNVWGIAYNHTDKTFEINEYDKSIELLEPDINDRYLVIAELV